MPRTVARLSAGILVLWAIGSGATVTAAQDPSASGSVDSRVLLTAPEGDTIAQLGPLAEPQIVREQGDWIQVRIEGWIRREAFVAGAGTERSLGLAELRRDPQRYEGQVVRWRVQHLGLQRADALRTDMPRGQPYLLMRDPGGETGFVYAIVPPSLLAASEDLAPLQRLEIVARIQTGSSPLTGHPIVELLELRP
jgi:hypothetical protein